MKVETVKTPSGLVVFDLDGTLLRGFTVCEVLAARLGHLDRMRELERFRSISELEAAREEMAKWYEGVPKSDLLSFIADAKLASGAKEGVHLLKTRGVAVGIASVTWDFAVQYFAGLFGVEYWLGTRLLDSGEIKHIWPEDKAHWAQRLREELRIPKGLMAAVGDSSGDIELLTTSDQAFYLGRDLPTEVDGCVHLPNASISIVCEHILKSLVSSPNKSLESDA